MNEFNHCDVFTNKFFRIRMAASIWSSLALLICLGTATPVVAGEGPCQIDEEPRGTLPMLDPVRDTVRGGIGRTRERVYITPPLEHDKVQLSLERTDGSNDGFITICVYDDDWRQARRLRVNQEQVWAPNILELTGRSVGESVETPPLENMQGRRLIVEVRNPSSRSRQRTFSYRLSLSPAPQMAANQPQIDTEDAADFCQEDASREPLVYGNLQRLEARFPEEIHHHSPMPINGDQVRVELEPSDSWRERRRSRGGVLVVCAVRGSDHPQGEGTSVRAILPIPSGRDFETDDPLMSVLDGFYQAGMTIHLLPAPYEQSTRRRWASRIARGGAVAGATVFTAGGVAVAGGAVAAEQVIRRSLSDGDEEESEYPLVMRVRVEPIWGTEPAEDVGTTAQPQEQAESTRDRRQEQERLRGPSSSDARDERGEPAARPQPASPTVLDEIAFGPMQAESEGYFRAPTTAPVGSLVPVEITYGERSWFDNLILVREDAPDTALLGSTGRNMHLIGDDDMVYRRAGDKPGVYEFRLRRHAGSDRRIMGRQQIEIVDVDIDLQVPNAVARGETFEIRMDPVIAGHLVITSADRDPESLVGRNARRNNAIEDADGPGVFTRRAPRTTGEYEVRFHFNPAERIGEATGRHGRLIARAPLNVVDADSLAQAEAEPEPEPAPGTTPAPGTDPEPELGPGPEPQLGPGPEPEVEAETPATQQQEYTEDCIGFNPRNLEIQPFGDRGARLLDGRHALMAFASRDDADAAVQVIQHYGFNRSCYVGRPNPSMHYFLVDGNPPEGSMSGEDCVRIDPGRVEAARVGGSWKLVQGNRWLMDFADSESEARQALQVVRQHGFTHSCFVARPDPALTYMRR